MGASTSPAIRIQTSASEVSTKRDLVVDWTERRFSPQAEGAPRIRRFTPGRSFIQETDLGRNQRPLLLQQRSPRHEFQRRRPPTTHTFDQQRTK